MNIEMPVEMNVEVSVVAQDLALPNIVAPVEEVVSEANTCYLIIPC